MFVLSDNDKTNNNHGASALKPPLHSTLHLQKNNDVDMEDDFIAELTHHMAHILLQDNDDSSNFSGICHNLEPSRDLTGSPQSTLWSPNHGSSQGSSQEPSPPATPADYEIQSSNSSNAGLCSYDSIIEEQIRAIELSGLKQEEVVSPKQKPVTCEKGEGKKKGKGKGKGGGGHGRRTRPGSPTTQQQGGAGGAVMRAVFIGGSGSIGGTGVFLPRAAPTESTKKQGKGCSVLIPARVVQALQQHYHKTAGAMSGPKVVGFPPLHDVLASNKDGIMYSLQSRKPPANVQNDEMTLPPEWTY